MTACKGSDCVPRVLHADNTGECPRCLRRVLCSPNPAGVVRFDAHDEQPWDHRMKDRGLYELRFNGAPQIEVMWATPPEMAATLIREMCDGLNAGYASRHDLGAGEVTGRPVNSQGDGSPAPIDRTPPAWREIINTTEEAEAWALKQRTYAAGPGIMHQAYLDEVDGRTVDA